MAKLALSCLFAALLCAGAFISVPLSISPVPLALGNFFAVLGGLLLGPIRGIAAVALYIALGVLGFPVFAGGRGGPALLLGPTGGYLLGYALGAAAAGFLGRSRKGFAVAAGTLAGFGTILASGALGLNLLSGLPWPKAIAVGVLPFIPGDLVKAALAWAVARRLGRFVDSLSAGPGRKARG